MTFPDDVTLSQWNQGWNESEMKKKTVKRESVLCLRNDQMLVSLQIQ